jgi:hypothetical protein
MLEYQEDLVEVEPLKVLIQQVEQEIHLQYRHLKEMHGGNASVGDDGGGGGGAGAVWRKFYT